MALATRSTAVRISSRIVPGTPSADVADGAAQDSRTGAPRERVEPRVLQSARSGADGPSWAFARVGPSIASAARGLRGDECGRLDGHERLAADAVAGAARRTVTHRSPAGRFGARGRARRRIEACRRSDAEVAETLAPMGADDLLVGWRAERRGGPHRGDGGDMTTRGAGQGEAASDLISARIAELGSGGSHLG